MSIQKNKKNILYLAHRIPYPPNKGDKIRAFNEVKYLAESNIVDLICLADNPDDLKDIYKSALQQFCRRIKIFPLNVTAAKIRGMIALGTGKTISEAWFYKREFQILFDRRVSQNRYDTIICFSSPMAEYIFNSAALKRLNNIPELIMDFCDLDSDKWIQYSRKAFFPMNIVYALEGKRLLEYEKRINLFFNRSIFVSEGEKELFCSYFKEAQELQVIPNGVDYQYFTPENTELEDKHINRQSNPAPMLMFSGAMDYHANVDGVLWFCKDILPVIREAFPDIIFYIVGSNPTGDVQRLAQDKGVVVTGFVEDIREYYRASDICVIPLRMARGVQNKVLEAMSTGKPVVTTGIAIQGICALPGRDLISADDSKSFAQTVIELLNNREKMKTLGGNAREYVMAHHDWKKNLAGLLTWLKKLHSNELNAPKEKCD